MLRVTVRCGECGKIKDVRYVGLYPIDEYECCEEGEMKELGLREEPLNEVEEAAINEHLDHVSREIFDYEEKKREELE